MALAQTLKRNVKLKCLHSFWWLVLRAVLHYLESRTDHTENTKEITWNEKQLLRRCVRGNRSIAVLVVILKFIQLLSSCLLCANGVWKVCGTSFRYNFSKYSNVLLSFRWHHNLQGSCDTSSCSCVDPKPCKNIIDLIFICDHSTTLLSFQQSLYFWVIQF